MSVRSRLPVPEGGATTTDTLGELRAWSGGVVEIERRDGTLVRLAERDLLAGRTVPPAPERRRSTVHVPGRPAAAVRSEADRAWRAAVARGAETLGPLRAARLDFTVAPGRWVDLDSLVEVAAAGLRDTGSALDALVATRREGAQQGLDLTRASAAALAAVPPPGRVAVMVEADELPLPGRREAKRALRARLARAWGGQPLLEGEVWADLALATTRALLPAMEPALDTLEPVLGRDPRGQPRQEFFPFDDRIVWLRVRRAPAPALALTLGEVRRSG